MALGDVLEIIQGMVFLMAMASIVFACYSTYRYWAFQKGHVIKNAKKCDDILNNTELLVRRTDKLEEFIERNDAIQGVDRVENAIRLYSSVMAEEFRKVIREESKSNSIVAEMLQRNKVENDEHY